MLSNVDPKFGSKIFLGGLVQSWSWLVFNHWVLFQSTPH